MYIRFDFVPLGIPRDYNELYLFHKGLLEGLSRERGIPVSLLISRLRNERLIEDFSLEASFPSEISRGDVLQFLGMSSAEWSCLVRTWGEYGPCETCRGVYWGADIYRLFQSFLDVGGLRGRPRCKPLVRAFRQRLDWMLSKVAAPVASEDLGVPRDFSELEKLYGKYIYEQVRRVSSIKTTDELQEVYQHTWISLIQADILRKFLDAAKTRLPKTLTLEDSLGYLGVSRAQWDRAVEDPSIWMPQPLRIGLYLAEDVRALDALGHLESTSIRRMPDATGRGFKPYLKTAIKNHFKNLLRTRSRRHKERVMSPSSIVTSDCSGLYRRVAVVEDATSWEDNLHDGSRDVPIEELLDVASKLRRHGVDPLSKRGASVLDAVLRGSDTVSSAAQKFS